MPLSFQPSRKQDRVEAMSSDSAAKAGGDPLVTTLALRMSCMYLARPESASLSDVSREEPSPLNDCAKLRLLFYGFRFDCDRASLRPSTFLISGLHCYRTSIRVVGSQRRADLLQDPDLQPCRRDGELVHKPKKLRMKDSLSLKENLGCCLCQTKSSRWFVVATTR